MNQNSNLDAKNQFFVSVDDKANKRPVASVRQCRVAHDLRNTLVVISGYCELIADADLNPRTRNHFQSICCAVMRMTALLEQCGSE
jgi:hypothetical protein